MPDEANAESQVQQEAVAIEPSEFDSLLNKEFKPKSEQAGEAIKNAVSTLAQHVLDRKDIIADEPIKMIEAIRAEIDRKLSEQINKIVHHEDFQTLEGSWRGLHHLVNNTETDETLKIKVLNISKKDLLDTLKKFKGTAWDQSPIFKKVYETEYGMFGGEPFGCMVGDYFFDHKPQDVLLLGEMSRIAASTHCPFIAAASPTVMNMDSWQELNEPRDLTKIFGTADYAPWRSLRESEDSRFIGLTMPRFLARLPYGAKTEPVDDFDFEEECDGQDHHQYCWANSAFAMGVNINRAFKLYGWCAKIRGPEEGGAVEGLPCHTFPSLDGGVEMKCPTEIAIPWRREAEGAKNGFIPLCHQKNSDFAAFIGAQSLQKPQEYEDPDATANANLSARLPYLFASCRFAHYLNAMVYTWIGKYTSANAMQRDLQDWINQYVCGNPDDAPQKILAKKPLAKAEVIVSDVEGNPGYFDATFWLRPHYQLEGLNVSLRLVAKLPSEKS